MTVQCLLTMCFPCMVLFVNLVIASIACTPGEAENSGPARFLTFLGSCALLFVTYRFLFFGGYCITLACPVDHYSLYVAVSKYGTAEQTFLLWSVIVLGILAAVVACITLTSPQLIGIKPEDDK